MEEGRLKSDGEQVKSSVRGEDDGGVCGPQWPRSRPEQCWAQEGGLDEGGGAHWVAQSQWVGGHRAQSWLGEGTGQEASCQSLGQLLLQGQFGLEKTGGASVRGQRGQRGQTGQRGQSTPAGQTCCHKGLNMHPGVLLCHKHQELMA